MKQFEALSEGLLESEKPSELDIVQLPEIVRLKEVPQDPKHHPEGNVYIHTMEVVDRAAMLKSKSWMTDKKKLVYMLGALLHDVGKWDRTFYRGKTKHLTHWSKPQPKGTRIVAYGHDSAGPSIVSKVFERMAPFEPELAQQVRMLVRFHMRPLLLRGSKLKAFQRVRDSGVDMYLVGMLSWADKNENPTHWWNRMEELNA